MDKSKAINEFVKGSNACVMLKVDAMLDGEVDMALPEVPCAVMRAHGDRVGLYSTADTRPHVLEIVDVRKDGDELEIDATSGDAEYRLRLSLPMLDDQKQARLWYENYGARAEALVTDLMNG